jgi:hypothetical protein
MKFLFSLTRIIPLLAVGILCGCSSFNRDWKKASVNSTDIQGRWEGTWTSVPSGHSDKLRCLVEKISEEKYRARFDSTYEKIIHFKSNVILSGAKTNSAFHFSGDAKLPWWAGGIYHYAGKVDPTNFVSTYRCKYDHGTFQMSRPQ